MANPDQISNAIKEEWAVAILNQPILVSQPFISASPFSKLTIDIRGWH
jgi:hypothetical protein